MKTPKSYTKAINEEKIVTPQILGEVLYSYNKRAKNMRDREREYRHSYDLYNNEDRYREKKEKYYSKKDALLNLVKPTCIHKVMRYKRVRYYDYEEEYDMINESEIVNSGYYYDKAVGELIYFVDIYEESEYEYFLFYKIGSYTFHHPIDENEVKRYNLEIKDIHELETYGLNPNELLSTTFCDKVYHLLMEKQIKLVA